MADLAATLRTVQVFTVRQREAVDALVQDAVRVKGDLVALRAAAAGDPLACRAVGSHVQSLVALRLTARLLRDGDHALSTYARLTNLGEGGVMRVAADDLRCVPPSLLMPERRWPGGH